MSWLRAIALIVLFPAVACAGSALDSLPAPPVPGRMIDLGGYRLHLWCTGSGSPTVVIVPGAGEFSFDWALVQPEVARFTRVCTCDRGGEAWSDLGPAPRTKTQEAFDLRRALSTAGERGPYVMVGHSAGGEVVRLFEIDGPRDVAGMVLVDSSTPEALTNLNGKVGTTLSFSRGRPIPAPRESLVADDRLTDVGISRIHAALASWDVTLDPPFDKLPPEQQRWHLWASSQSKHFISMSTEYLGEEAERIQAQNVAPLPLASLPLQVLCRDTTVEKGHTPGHAALQERIAHLSRRGEFQIAAGSGHHMHLDRPDVVIGAIRKVVDEVRKDGGKK
jgi:pimeloyl-ACP methyl ester carboxylesterase